MKQSLYFRYFHARHAEWLPLFQAAALSHAPNVSMFDLVAGDFISGSVAFTGFHELALTRHLAGRADAHGGLFVDVGANMGYFSLLWTGRNPSARAVAIEASPRNIPLLQNNIARNGLESRLTLLPYAAGAQQGTMTFDVGPADQTGWGGISHQSTDTTIEVQAIRLDDHLAAEEIEVLKIDVEGAETWILQGCEKLLKEKRVKVVFFEQNAERMNRLGIRQNEAQDFLRSLGYRCRAITRQGDEWMAVPAGV